MQPTAHIAALVGGVISLLLIATVTRAVARRLKLPFTVVLVLVGIGLAAWSATYPHVWPMLHDLEISSALIFYVFLPTLIFESAFNLDVRQLYDNLGSVLVAEEVLNVSGIMATIAAGLTIGGWGRMKVSYAVRDYLEHFWEYVAFLANALIFLMVGLRVDLGALWATLGLLCWVVVAMLVSRAVVVYGLMPFVQRLPRAQPISNAYKAVIFWGGLRGAIALALVLSLPPFAQREVFVALVMGAVLATLLLKGLSIEWLVRWLGLDAPSLADRLARLEGDFTAKQSAMDCLPTLLSSGLFAGAIAMRLQVQYEKRLDSIKAAIEELHRTELVDDDTQRALLSLRGLAEEKSLYVEMFNKGHLSERAFRQLLLVRFCRKFCSEDRPGAVVPVYAEITRRGSRTVRPQCGPLPQPPPPSVFS